MREYVFSAKGAVFMTSLGQPRTLSGLKARFMTRSESWGGHVFSVRTGCNDVARTSSLLYRGFLIRRGCACSACNRLEVGDTAGWKPALQKSRAELLMSAAPLTLNTNQRKRPSGGTLILHLRLPRQTKIRL
jgi:hypothetical protein